MDEAIIACAEIVHRGDPERFMATMAAPVKIREKLFPLYAFNIEVSRAPWVTQESMIAEMRLQWWRDALTEIGNGKQVRQHEVVTPLSQVLTVDDAALLEQLVEARRWDIYRDPFEDEAAFDRYIDMTAGNLLRVAVGAAGGGDEVVLQDASRAQGIANWLRAIPALEQAGRIPLIDGREAAVKALARDGLNALARARAARKQISQDARPVMLVLWQAGAVLRQAAADPSMVKAGQLGRSQMRERLSLMMRAATKYW